MAIKKENLDDLLAGSGGNDPFGKDGLLGELKKALSESRGPETTWPAPEIHRRHHGVRQIREAVKHSTTIP